MRVRWPHRVIVVACLGWYLGCSLYQLPLPGLEYDEAIFGPPALGYTQDFLTGPAAVAVDSPARFSPIAFTPFAPRFGSYQVPLMVTPYQGALKVHLLAAVFSCWGVSPWTLRVPNVVIGGATLVLFFALLARVWTPGVAVLALALLATDPSYLFYTRHDFNPSAWLLLLVIAPLWCLVRGSDVAGGRSGWWAAAGLLFGLGVYNRLDYLWFLAAMAITALLWGWRQGWGWISGRRRALAWAMVFFLLGCSPYLFFVWQRPTIARSVWSLAVPAQDLAAVLQVKGYVLWTVLNGTSLLDFFAARSGVNLGKEVTPEGEVRVGSYVAARQQLVLSSLYTGTLTPFVAVVVAVLLCRLRPPPLLQLLMLFLSALVFSVGSVAGALRGHHFVVFLPFVQVFVAAALGVMGQHSRTRWGRMVWSVVAGACLVTNLLVVFRYHTFLAATGGRGVWSEAIYALTEYLEAHCHTQRCLLGDWGLGTQVVTLAARPLQVEEVFWPYIHGASEAEAETLVCTPPAFFVFYSDRYTNFSRPKQIFFAAARRCGATALTERVFVERDGTPVIEVVSFRPGPASGAAAE
ncbi:MAG: glycosyltransferase family 39 protein [Candidatus Binatia bacterium]|nr:glycosyltransferase family 39 protein [Candidatus Binatia bacterium]